jgi:hypothetical protein
MLNYDDVLSQVKRVALELFQRNRDMRDVRGWDGASSGQQSVEIMSVELDDLDSFTFIQLAAELEELYALPLLRSISAFEGETLDDLAEFIVKRAHESGELPDGGH